VDARTPLQPFVWLSSWGGLRFAVPAAALLALVAYVGLAGRAPGVALLVATVFGFTAVLGSVLSASPVERKITVERQAEVVAYRLLVALVVYFGVGFLVLWGLNSLSPEQARVPIAWEGSMFRPWENPFFRRVTFWPFYALVLVGCQGLLPTPPGAC
jgi:hypothetical protein